MSYKNFEQKTVFRFNKKETFEEKAFWIYISLLTCHIFNMHHFSRHSDVKNGLISNKFEVFKFF